MAMIQESYSYQMQTEPSESLADLSPVVPDQKPPLAPPQMHIQAAKRPTTERGGNAVTTLQLEIPEKGYLPPSPSLDPSLSTSSIGPPSASASTHLDNEATIRKFLVDAGNSFLRPRSRANTLTSSQVDNALGILAHLSHLEGTLRLRVITTMPVEALSLMKVNLIRSYQMAKMVAMKMIKIHIEY
jgi:hypothetical protein